MFVDAFKNLILCCCFESIKVSAIPILPPFGLIYGPLVASLPNSTKRRKWLDISTPGCE